MPNGRAPGELSKKEHQERLRRWVKHLWGPLEKAGRDKKDLAEALGLSKTTVTNYINDKDPPGLECLIRLHFRQGLDPRRMLREEPPGELIVPARPPPPTSAQHPAQQKRAARR